MEFASLPNVPEISRTICRPAGFVTKGILCPGSRPINGTRALLCRKVSRAVNKDVNGLVSLLRAFCREVLCYWTLGWEKVADICLGVTK